MDHRSLDVPEQRGTSRRQVLRVGVVVAGAAAGWTAPTVSVLGLNPSSAAQASHHGSGGGGGGGGTPTTTCTSVVTTSSTAYRLTGPAGTSVVGPSTGYSGTQTGSASDTDTTITGTLPAGSSVSGPTASSAYAVGPSSSTSSSSSQVASGTITDGTGLVLIEFGAASSRAEAQDGGTQDLQSQVAALRVVIAGTEAVDVAPADAPFNQSGTVAGISYAVLLNERDSATGTARAARVTVGDIELVLAESIAGISKPTCMTTP